MADQLKILISADMKKAKSDLDKFKKEVQTTKVNFGSAGITKTRSEIDKTTKSLNLLGSSLLSNISKFSLWFAIGTAISSISSAMRYLGDTVIETDRTITLMSFTIDKTENQLYGMVDATTEFAGSIGSLSSEALEAVKIFTNMSATMDEILERSENSIILNNLSRIGIEASADALQSLQNQFKLTDDEASSLVDTLTFVSANLSMDFSKGIKEISMGIANSGKTAKDSGFTVEQYVALLGKSVESSRKSASQLSSGFRTIFSRIKRTKDLTIEEISDLEGAYKSVGINIRKSETEFKDMPVLLDELVAKLGDLSEANQETAISMISEASAGIRQADTFRTMIDVWTEANMLASESSENIGFAIQKNEQFVQSLDGRVNVLKNTFEEYSRSVLDVDTLKSIVDGTTDFVKVLQALKDNSEATSVALTTLGGAILYVKRSTIEANLLGFSSALLKMNPVVLGIVAGVGLLTSAIISHDLAQQKLNERLEETTENLSNTNREFINNKEAINRFDELGKKIDKTGTELEEYSNLQKELNSILPEAKDKIDAQNLSLEEQINLYTQLNNELKDNAIEQAQRNLDEFGNSLEVNEIQIKKNEDRIEGLKLKIVEYRDELRGLDKSSNDFGERQKFIQHQVSILTEDLDKLILSNSNLQKENELVKKSQDLLTIANSDAIVEVDSLVSAHNRESLSLSNLSNKTQEELDIMLKSEKEHTDKVLSEIKKRINARISELSVPFAGKEGGEYLQFAQGVKDPIINELMKRREAIDLELRKTKEAINDVTRETGEGFRAEDSEKKKKETESLTKAQRELLEINHQLSLTQEDLAQSSEDSASKIVILNALIDLQKDKFHALSNSIAEVESQYKSGDLTLDEYTDQMNDFELQQEKTTTSIKGFIKEAEGLLLKDQKEAVEELNDELEKLTDTLDDSLSEAIDEVNKRRENAVDYIQAEIDSIKDKISSLKDENDERERTIKLQELQQNLTKAQLKLANIQKEKNVRVLVGTEFVYQSDARKVADQTENVASAQKALADEQRSQREDARISELESEISKLEKEKKETEESYDARIKSLKRFQSEYKRQIEQDGEIQQSLLKSINNALRSVNASYFADTISGYSDMVSQINGLVADIATVESGGTPSSGGSSGGSTSSKGGVKAPNTKVTKFTGGSGTTYTYNGKEYRVKHDGLRSGDVSGSNPFRSNEIASVLEKGEYVLTNKQFTGLDNLLSSFNNIPQITPTQSSGGGGISISGDITLALPNVQDAKGFAIEFPSLIRQLATNS